VMISVSLPKGCVQDNMPTYRGGGDQLISPEEKNKKKDTRNI
jgi:hypothetical protein